MSALRRRKHNSNRAQSLIEMVVGFIALAPVMLVIFDLAVIVLSIQTNDSVCRDAARAAAAGSPSEITQRASLVVAQENSKATGLASNFQLVSCTTTTPANYSSTDGLYGGTVPGQVTAVTQVDVRPFVVQWAYGGTLPLKFRSQQTFPVTYILPNNTTSASP